MATRYPILPSYAQQEALNIEARRQAALAVAQQKADLEAAKIQAKSDADAMARAAAQGALQTRTNAAWNELLFKEAQKNKPKPIRVTEKDDLLGASITRDLSPAEFEAEKRSKKLGELTSKRDLLKSEWQMPFGLSRVPSKLAAVEDEIKAASAPTDLLAPQASPMVAASAPAALVDSRTPTMFNGTTSMSGPGFAPVRGSAFIGTPGGPNLFQDTSGQVDAPAQAPAWGREVAAVEAPTDLLRSNSFPAGYNPNLGSFQVGEAAPVPQDAPMAEFKSPPKTHIQALMADPQKLSGFFDQKYGKGSAERVLQDAMAREESQP